MTLMVKFQIFDLDSKPLETTANRYIAAILMNRKSAADTLKLYELALKIDKGETIEIDTNDLKLIEAAVKETQLYNNMINGAILQEIEAQKARAAGAKGKKETDGKPSPD